MEFRVDEGENGWNGLENEREGKNRKIDDTQDHPAITVRPLTSFQQNPPFFLAEQGILISFFSPGYNQPDPAPFQIDQ